LAYVGEPKRNWPRPGTAHSAHGAATIAVLWGTAFTAQDVAIPPGGCTSFDFVHGELWAAGSNGFYSLPLDTPAFPPNMARTCGGCTRCDPQPVADDAVFVSRPSASVFLPAVLDMGGSSPSLLTPFGPARTALALRPSGDAVLVFEGPTWDTYGALTKFRANSG